MPLLEVEVVIKKHFWKWKRMQRRVVLKVLYSRMLATCMFEIMVVPWW